MVSAKVIINNEQGLHARPAGIISKAAAKCTSNTFLIYKEKKIQLKSNLNIMAAALKYGTEVELQCTGENEQTDLETLISTFENDIKDL